MEDAVWINTARCLADPLDGMELTAAELRLLRARAEARQLLPGDHETIATLLEEFLADVDAGRASLSDLRSDDGAPSSMTVHER